ncbi:MAG: VWA domain-containing protein [Acidobacteria bacterium]|nr:VWA domain-containing protein [Acidobacteriota bacterium]
MALLAGVSLGAQARERVAYVSLVERATGAARNTLAAADIVIREDDVTREVLRVTPATGPLPIAVLVDTSAGAEATIPDVRQALTAFLAALGDTGPVALIGYGERPTVLTNYTNAREALEAGIGKVFARPGAGATVMDAIFETARGLATREGERAAIVVVSATTPEQSNIHFTRVLSRLETSGASLHVVTLTAPGRALFDDNARQRDTLFDRGVRLTGGTRRDVVASQAFPQALTEVARVLTHQFRVVYARPQTLIPPDTFVVTATAPGLIAYGGVARGQPK